MSCSSTAHTTHTQLPLLGALRRTVARSTPLQLRGGRGPGALGPRLPALSGSSAGTRGQHFRLQRSSRRGAGFGSAEKSPSNTPGHANLEVRAALDHPRASGPGRHPHVPHTSRAKRARSTAQAWRARAATVRGKGPHTNQSTSAWRGASPALRALPSGPALNSPAPRALGPPHAVLG